MLNLLNIMMKNKTKEKYNFKIKIIYKKIKQNVTWFKLNIQKKLTHVNFMVIYKKFTYHIFYIIQNNHIFYTFFSHKQVEKFFYNNHAHNFVA